MKTTIKYICSVFLILGGLGFLTNGSFLSGILLILLGIIILPPISDNLKTKINVWKSKGMRYVSYVVLFIISSALSNTDDIGLNTEAQNNPKVSSQEYITKTAYNISQLSEERKTSRLKLENELKATSTYKEMIENNIVSVEYLPIISAINDGLRSTGKGSGLIVNHSLMNQLQNSKNGKDKTNFMIKALSLSTPGNGGFTEEFVQVLVKYKKQYGLYGEAGRVYMSNGTTETLPYSFDISSIFYHINPTNKNLNAIYEAHKEGISQWLAQTDNGTYIYGHLATKQGYLDYAKKVNPNGPYTLKVDYELTANQLYKAYDDNEIAADNKYKGKKLAVTGKISDISEVFGNIAVDLKSDDGIGWTTIRCTMKNRDEVSKLRKGQKVTIIGTCDGLTLNVAINLEDCEVWQD